MRPRSRRRAAGWRASRRSCSSGAGARGSTTAPIKGTIRRDVDPAAAAAARRTLQASAKDAAEHVMIVDLMRNDLGRVCTYGSVVAPPEPTAEPHPGLWHLVSRVHGELRPEVGNREPAARHVPARVRHRRAQGAGVEGDRRARARRRARSTRARSVLPAPSRGSSSTSRSGRSSAATAACGWAPGAGSSPTPIPAPSSRRRCPRRARSRPRSAARWSCSGGRMQPERPDPSLGVFETLLVSDRRVQAPEAHLDRLRRSVSELYGLELPAGLLGATMAAGASADRAAPAADRRDP